MIDLHLHTDASDGLDTPQDLVARSCRAGLTTISVTDHDTVAAVDRTAGLAREAGIRLVPGIEITTRWHGEEVHVLGYFLDHRSAHLAGFLDALRADRVRRVQAIAVRLARLGVPIDAEAVLERAAAEPDRSIGRPQIARALVDAGHVQNAVDAFELYLGEGRPACLPRADPPSPARAIAVIAASGGVSSLAHPGLLRSGAALIRILAGKGLDAVEAYHSDHVGDAPARYSQLAAACDLVVTGGSDYHGDAGHGAPMPGSVLLPPEDFERLADRAGRGRGNTR